MRLNEITTMVENKSHLTQENESLVKEIFKEINENGERYDVDEIESWFKNEGSWNNKDVRTRIVNISHYSQSKFEQTNKFRIVDDSCSDGDSCSCGH
ncbi:MAG: hypothetical protein VX587_02550 [Thermoproteota archaeon]|nr:hypothetical protein [Thermoproteota archaeon]